MVNEISNFGQGLYPPTCIYGLMEIIGKSLDPFLNSHISCYITDTDGRCKPMNLGCLWICLVGITPSNNPGTEREILPYMVRDSPYVALYGHWATPLVMNTIPGQGNTVFLYLSNIGSSLTVCQFIRFD